MAWYFNCEYFLQQTLEACKIWYQIYPIIRIYIWCILCKKLTCWNRKIEWEWEMIHFVQKYCFDVTIFMKRKKNRRTKIACLNVFLLIWSIWVLKSTTKWWGRHLFVLHLQTARTVFSLSENLHLVMCSTFLPYFSTSSSSSPTFSDAGSELHLLLLLLLLLLLPSPSLLDPAFSRSHSQPGVSLNFELEPSASSIVSSRWNLVTGSKPFDAFDWFIATPAKFPSQVKLRGLPSVFAFLKDNPQVDLSVPPQVQRRTPTQVNHSAPTGEKWSVDTKIPWNNSSGTSQLPPSLFCLLVT